MGDDGQLRRMADGQAHALILIEIANFAEVRRAVGIDRAASLAPLLAARVAAVLPTAKVAAIGRDTVELSIAVDAEDFVSIVADLQRDLDAAIDIDGATHALRVSIGSALTAEGNRIELVEAAEASLVRARTAREPGSDAIFATPASEHDIALGEELRIAVERDELFLQYQPKLHLRRQEVTSIEALIRWRHPQRGLVMPNDFIPTAERSDAIEAMSLWTLRRVIADQRTLAQHGHDLPIFINMSGVLLSDQEFVAVVCELVEASGARLGFEVTETSVIREPELAIAHLQRFADIGVAITIDDYGAGLSSLAYLKQLPARELKIDKMFVTQLSSSHRDPLIVRSTIDLAHALEMEVVAEGVETPTSLALLAVMGCDMVQGFLISRPLVLDDLLVFLREERHRGVMEQSRAPLQQLAKVRAGQ